MIASLNELWRTGRFVAEHPVAMLEPDEQTLANWIVAAELECARYRDQIIAKIEQGLTAQRIYQDLVSDYGFTAKYHSVRRFVGTLINCKELPVRRIEVEAGQEIQIDYGQGARCMDHTGKLQ